MEDLKILAEQWLHRGIEFVQTNLRDVSSRQGAAVTSMELDQGTFLLHTEITMTGKPKPVQLFDVPGHPRFRSTLEICLLRAAAVVFVVDSLEFLLNCRAASEDLYNTLTNGTVVTNRIPLLFCCNKTEKVTAHTGDFITRQMERELERLRSKRNDFTFGIEGQVFSFSHCRNKVTVAEVNLFITFIILVSITLIESLVL